MSYWGAALRCVFNTYVMCTYCRNVSVVPKVVGYDPPAREALLSAPVRVGKGVSQDQAAVGDGIFHLQLVLQCWEVWDLSARHSKFLQIKGKRAFPVFATKLKVSNFSLYVRLWLGELCNTISPRSPRTAVLLANKWKLPPVPSSSAILGITLLFFPTPLQQLHSASRSIVGIWETLYFAVCWSSAVVNGTTCGMAFKKEGGLKV